MVRDLMIKLETLKHRESFIEQHRVLDLTGLKPRAPGFETEDAAAIDALKYANPLSIRDNREYGGLVYYNPHNRRFYATQPSRTSVDTWKEIGQMMPRNSTKLGTYHTHGAYRGSASEDPASDRFSGNDLQYSFERDEKVSYLGTPSGKYFKWERGFNQRTWRRGFSISEIR